MTEANQYHHDPAALAAPLTAALAGRFIVLDGPDGAGKGTQLELLARTLRGVGVAPVIARDPGGTPIGTRIREILLDRRAAEMTARCELMLYMASRAQLAAEVIRPALDAGRLVLGDRYVSSTIAYQGAAGVEAELIRRLADEATDSLRPDLTLILDIDSETGLARATARAAAQDQAADRMEAKGAAYHRRVRELFAAQATADPAHFTVINATADPDAVHLRVLQAIAKKFAD